MIPSDERNNIRHLRVQSRYSVKQNWCGIRKEVEKNRRNDPVKEKVNGWK